MIEAVLVWSRHMVLTILALLPVGYAYMLFTFTGRSFLGVPELARSALYNIPALLVAGLPLAIAFATLTLFTHYGAHLAERARLAVLVLAMALTMVSFILANELVPQANRGVPMVFELYRTPGLLFEDPRGRRRQDMTTRELGVAIRDMRERGLNTRAYELTYHLRFALPALTFAWCLVGMGFGYLLSLSLSGSGYGVCAAITLPLTLILCTATYIFWTAVPPPFGLSPLWIAWLPVLTSILLATAGYVMYYYEEHWAI